MPSIRSFQPKTLSGVIFSTILLAVLASSTVIGGIGLEAFYGLVKQARMNEMGLVAAGKEQELIFLFNRMNRRVELALGEIERDCQGRRPDAACIRQKLHGIVRMEGVEGAIFREAGGSPSVSVGREPDVPLETVEFKRDQLAYFPDRKAGLERTFFLKARNQNSQRELWLIFPVALLKPIFIKASELGESGETFLTDHKGVFITDARYDTARAVSHPISARPMQTCLSGVSTQALDLDYREVPVIHGFRFLPEIGGGCIMAHFDQQEAFASFHFLAGSFIIVMAAFLLVVAYVSFKLSRSITRPIQELETAIQAFINGDGQRVPVRGTREINSLMQRFNELAEQVLAANQDREQIYKVLSDSAIVVVTDCAGTVIDLNAKFTNASGFTREEALAKSVCSFYAKDRLPAGLHAEVSEALAAGKTWSGEIEKITKDGASFWTFTVISPIKNVAGKIIKHLHVEFEITELKAIQATLSFSNQLISMGELSAGIAHELNNPVSIVLGSVKQMPALLEQPEKLKSKIEGVRKSAERIAKIVAGLKKYSRRCEEPEYQLVSLCDVVKESLVLVEPKAKVSDTKLGYDCRSDGYVLCDEVKIEQILINLIGNGIDAVESLEERWVSVSLFESDSAIVLQVRDSGRGIPPAVRAKLFRSFYTTKPSGRGTGLGLSIVKNILEEHHATIEVLEHDPHTCFEVRFPKVNVARRSA